MGSTTDLLDGVASLLASRTAWTYDRTGFYTAAQTGIVHVVVPAAPDRVVVLTPYLPDDDPTLSDSQVRVQVRFRGTRDYRVASDMNDAAFDILQNLPRSILNGVTVVGAWRTSGAYIGPDSNGRHEFTANYRFQTHRPSPNRT